MMNENRNPNVLASLLNRKIVRIENMFKISFISLYSHRLARLEQFGLKDHRSQVSKWIIYDTEIRIMESAMLHVLILIRFNEFSIQQ